MKNATKIMLCASDSTFFKDFAENSQVFHKIQVYLQTWNFKNKIQEFFQDFKVRGNPGKVMRSVTNWPQQWLE